MLRDEAGCPARRGIPPCILYGSLVDAHYALLSQRRGKQKLAQILCKYGYGIASAFSLLMVANSVSIEA